MNLVFKSSPERLWRRRIGLGSGFGHDAPRHNLKSARRSEADGGDLRARVLGPGAAVGLQLAEGDGSLQVLAEQGVTAGIETKNVRCS